MKKLRKIIKYYTDRRFSTIAGTLVYFLLMSITPFFLWLTLLVGRVDFSSLLSHELFAGVAPFISYLNGAAASAAGGAGIVLLATSLWSSTNFFYHLRRSGEIIYGCNRVKQGLKLRLVSLLHILFSIVLAAVLATVFVAGNYFLKLFLPDFISEFFILAFITLSLFFIAVLLNKIACPYRLSFDDAATGSLLTTALWLVFAVGFGVYLKFASPEKLYGAIASIIVFLLWCYIMMSCFVIGMIENGSYSFHREYKRRL